MEDGGSGIGASSGAGSESLFSPPGRGSGHLDLEEEGGTGTGAGGFAPVGDEMSFDLDVTGNPVWKDPGSLFTLSQYRTPLAMEWSRKRAEAEEAAKAAKAVKLSNKRARVGL